MRRTARPAPTRAAGALALLAVLACHFDPAYRDDPGPSAPACTVGARRCDGDLLQKCAGPAASPSWTLTSSCSAEGLLCSTTLLACAHCEPGSLGCQGQQVVSCSADGSVTSVTQTCDTGQGYACRDGSCVQLCEAASALLSNVGCEYWGVDLDNADVSPTLNAASQQYAIVVSNVQPDVAATVTVSQDDSASGTTDSDVVVVTSALISPQNLEVFNLGPREVDGSADGTFNTGTGTALTRHAYRVTSDFPIVAYQFNPLDNVDVFSNDASALLPVSGLNTGNGVAYVVPAWPQTIAETNDPSTNFGINLRAFLAVVATRPNTHVTVQPTARIIPGGPFASGLAPGAGGTVTLQPYDVLNLETGDFDADLTGSLVSADEPVAVFPGSEASDSPEYDTLADRYCCADHLEHQTPPLRSVGKSYVLAKMPNRTSAVIAAGGAIGEVDETEYYRVMAVQAGTTHVTTTLPSPWDAFDLTAVGDFQTIPSKGDFMLTASQPALVLEVQSGQDAGGVPSGLPGGDPSTLVPAPVEQWRSDYVLLTPDKYVFDYLVVVAPSSAHVYVDTVLLTPDDADVTPSDGLTPDERHSQTPPYWTYRYQLSHPVISPENQVLPGKQNDGVHHLQADEPVGVIAYGFDSYVSYAYAGGTELTVINPQ